MLELEPGPASSTAVSRPEYALSTEELEGALGSGAGGLDRGEAARRLIEFGPNSVQEERPTPSWVIALRQFRDPLIYILLGAAVVTLLLEEYLDAGVIALVLFINAIIGFVQEIRAQSAMRALASLSAPRADVLREGVAIQIASREVVPGDVVLLTAGSRVPADVRLVEARQLEIDESAMTGESLPARKGTVPLPNRPLVPGDQVNIAFSGTVVTRGRGRGYAVRTGERTELGRLARSMRELTHPPTPLQQKVERLGKRIGAAVALLCGLVIATGLARGMPTSEIFLSVVAMAVATIPEGLPIVLTVTLTIGVRRMARRKAVIRHLPAVETLGSTTVIGSDKTGTLTRNEMTVRKIWAGGEFYEATGGGYEPHGHIRNSAGAAVSSGPGGPLYRTLLTGVLANEADAASLEVGEPSGDPTEIALYVAAGKGGLSYRRCRAEYPEIDVLPFESERRMMATLNQTPEGRCVFVKGAPEAVLSRCIGQLGASGAERLQPEVVRAAARRLASEGLRVLAMAYRPTEGSALTDAEVAGDFLLAGLQGMEDPVRAEAVEAVKAARAAGIRVLMLTGDHADTATAIGRQLGLGGKGPAVEGRVLDGIGDSELDRILADADTFARVAPEHKLRIVERLKARGEIVAVTGDGINDAPALRAAHLGISMGRSGTDVAREASDMVLADDNFATITAAVEEGRVVFANVRKVTFFLLSTGVAMPLAILAALLFGWPLPFIAVQILWINLVTNGLQDVALAFEPGEPDLLRRPPRPPNEAIVNFRLLERLLGVAVVVAAGTLLTFWWVLEASGDVQKAQSVAMTQMVVFQFFHVFNSRSLDRSIFEVPLFSNRFLFVSIVAAAAAHWAVLHAPPLQTVFRTVPLTNGEWLMVFGVGASVIAGGELDKWRNRRRGTPLG